MRKNKKLGIISGMGTRAGLFFVNKLIDRLEAPKDQDFPEFVLHNNSQVPDRTLSIVYGQESPQKELLRSIGLMSKCNVDIIVSTCITSYHFLDQLDEGWTHNILHPIDLLLQNLNKNHQHLRRVGVLATTGTIRSKLFHRKFKESNFELVFLNEQEQEENFMKAVYMDGGFKSSHILDEAFDLFQGAVNSLKMKEIDVIVGGCTEVQIGFSRIRESLPYIDLVDVMVDEVIQYLGLKTKVLV